METLQQGSRAIPVVLLQRLLNKKGVRPKLVEDGVFGPNTRSAVVSCQARERIAQDGIVGPITWARLGLTIDIDHPVKLFSQQTRSTCWSAAATMVEGTEQSIGGPQFRTDEDGRLLLEYVEDLREFARTMGWEFHRYSPSEVTALAGLMKNRPVLVVTRWGRSLHAIVFSALWSDGTKDGTLLRIHDPWPPNSGRVYGSFYQGFRTLYDPSRRSFELGVLLQPL